MIHRLITALACVVVAAACSDEIIRKNYASLEIDPLAIDFGRRPTGSVSVRSVTLSNTGTSDLTFERIELRDDTRAAFSRGDAPATLRAQTKVTIELTYFAPGVEGPDGARLVIDSNADNAPQLQVSLAGRSESPCPEGETACGTACARIESDDSNCGQCGTVCSSPLRCRASRCVECFTSVECGTDAVCVEGECLSCPAEATFNECGVCGGPRVTGAGSTCTATNGCESAQLCDDAGTGVICANVEKNECGRCGGPTVAGVGGSCTSNGCESTLACSADGTSTVCTPVAKNACGVCGGPAVAGFGDACTSNGCPSTNACNADGTAAVCTEVVKNACGVCGGPAVTGIGDACTSNGCASTYACNAGGSAAACTAVVKNACGTCGGATVVGLGDACTSNGCPSALGCNAQGSAAVCQPVTKNECDVCGGPAVSDVGDVCTSNGCGSAFTCSTDGTAAVCQSVARNECGVCGGARLADHGKPCAAADACAGAWTCAAGGDSLSCTSSAGTPALLSGSGGGTWRYKRAVAITGSSAGLQHDYAVAVALDLAGLIGAGKLQASAADLRFTNACGSELPWWWEKETSSSRVWIKIDRIPADGTAITAYYGNVGATAGGAFANNGKATFSAFDDFEGGSLDPAVWLDGVDTRFGPPAVQAGGMHFYVPSFNNALIKDVQTAATFTGGRVAEFNLTMDNRPSNPSWKSSMWLTKVGSPSGVVVSPIAGAYSGWWSNGQQECVAPNGTYQGRVELDAAAGTFKLFFGTTLCRKQTGVSLSAPYVFYFSAQSDGILGVDLWDFRVRPFVVPEPVAGVLGAEQGT